MLTKHVPSVDEALLKCHVTVTEDGQVSPIVSEIVPNDAVDLCGGHINMVVPDSKGKLKVTVAEAKLSEASGVGNPLHKLYNLEAPIQPEKQFHIDLDVDLYQMEDY